MKAKELMDKDFVYLNSDDSVEVSKVFNILNDLYALYKALLV